MDRQVKKKNGKKRTQSETHGRISHFGIRRHIFAARRVGTTYWHTKTAKNRERRQKEKEKGDDNSKIKTICSYSRGIYIDLVHLDRPHSMRSGRLWGSFNASKKKISEGLLKFVITVALPSYAFDCIRPLKSVDSESFRVRGQTSYHYIIPLVLGQRNSGQTKHQASKKAAKTRPVEQPDPNPQPHLNFTGMSVGQTTSLCMYAEFDQRGWTVMTRLETWT